MTPQNSAALRYHDDISAVVSESADNLLALRLTTIDRQPTIARMRSWRRSILALLLLTAVSGSAWASCVGDTASDMPQMACCAAGHEQCPMHDANTACCTVSVTPAPTQGTLVKVASISAPDARAIDFVLHSSNVPSGKLASQPFDSSPPARHIPPPPYIAFSSLLI